MTGVIMIQEQDIVVFQGRGDERLALGQSISHPDLGMSRRISFARKKGGAGAAENFLIVSRSHHNCNKWEPKACVAHPKLRTTL